MVVRGEEYLRGNERAQVGIGTLIVFIAMVLVAAVAAGVLVNTAGFLQQQSETTGTETTDMVSTGLAITSVTGNVSSSEVDHLYVNVKIQPGSKDVDLDMATIQYVDHLVVKTLIHNNTNAMDGSHYRVTRLRDDDSSLDVSSNSFVLNSENDVATIIMNISAIRTADGESGGLEERRQATIRITPPSGPVSTQKAVVPRAIGGLAKIDLNN